MWLLLTETTTTTTTTSSSECVTTWTERAGVNSEGGRPQSGIRTLSACQQTCAANPQCVAVDWNSRPLPGQAHCWLHLDSANLRRRYATPGVTQYELTNRCTSPAAATTTAAGTLALLLRRRLSVCLSVRSHISKTTSLNFTKFSAHFNIVTMTQFFSDDTAISYVLPVLWMTSCFHIMGHIARERREDSVTA